VAVQPQTDEQSSADTVPAHHCVQGQALIREVNEQIHHLGLGWGADADLCNIVCECANPDCLAPIHVPSQTYEQVRRFPTRFVLAPEHVLDAFQRVVEEAADYVVVETVGPAAATAVRLDPRRAVPLDDGDRPT
jgi:hypothetical protein